MIVKQNGSLSMRLSTMITLNKNNILVNNLFYSVKNANIPQNIPSDIKNSIKTISLEEGLH